MLATTQGPGSLLKSTREARGITLIAVHEATKIPMDVLRAIEEGYTVRTISPFYLRGFIKMYAVYLRVNVQEPEIDRQNPAPVKTAPVKTAPVMSFMDEGFDFYQWLTKTFTIKRRQQMAVVFGVFFALFLLFKVITFFTHKHPSSALKETIRKEQQTKVVPPVVPSSPKKNMQAVVSLPPMKGAVPLTPPLATKILVKDVAKVAQPVKAVVKQAPVQQQVIQKDIILTVKAKKDCWLRVESDGVVVFQSSLSQGKSESWIAGEKIEISGKNMQQLEFEVNGKLLGVLSRRDRNAKKIVITKEGLSVLQ